MTAMAWTVPARVDWRWESFEEACFLYHPLSGETHLLNELARKLLESLAERPATLETLIHQHGQLAGAAAQQVGPEIIRAWLAELDRLGLIFPLAP